MTTFAYNARKQVTTKTYTDGTPAVTYCYDGQAWTGTFGQCTGSRTAPLLGRLTDIGTSESRTRYTNYDSLGRITASSQYTNGNWYNFGYQYNLAGGLKQMVYPSGRTVSYGYTGAGRASTVTGSQASVTTHYTAENTQITYAPHGAPVSTTLGNGLVETRTYDARLRMAQMQAGSLLTLGYVWGANNNLEWQVIQPQRRKSRGMLIFALARSAPAKTPRF